MRCVRHIFGDKVLETRKGMFAFLGYMFIHVFENWVFRQHPTSSTSKYQSRLQIGRVTYCLPTEVKLTWHQKVYPKSFWWDRGSAANALTSCGIERSIIPRRAFIMRRWAQKTPIPRHSEWLLGSRLSYALEIKARAWPFCIGSNQIPKKQFTSSCWNLFLLFSYVLVYCPVQGELSVFGVLTMFLRQPQGNYRNPSTKYRKNIMVTTLCAAAAYVLKLQKLLRSRTTARF